MIQERRRDKYVSGGTIVRPRLTLSCDLLRLPDVNVWPEISKLHRSQQTVGDVRLYLKMMIHSGHRKLLSLLFQTSLSTM